MSKQKTLTIEQFKKAPEEGALVVTSARTIDQADLRGLVVKADDEESLTALEAALEKMNAPKACAKEATNQFRTFPGAGDMVSGFILSSKSVDSYGDTIDPKGWDLVDFKSNPVVLFGHASYAPPIGRDIARWTDKEFLRGMARYTAKEINPFGDMIGRMVKNGFLSTTSVGFAPIEWELSDDEERKGPFGWGGIDFKKQKLKEWSVVPIPANPDAVSEARSVAGLNDDHMRAMIEWCERALDGEGVLVVPRTLVEQTRKVAKGEGISIAPGLSLVRADDEESTTPGDAATDEDEPKDEEEEEKASTATCPSCGHSGPSADFAITETTDEKADDADPDADVDDEDEDEDEEEIDEEKLAEIIAEKVMEALERAPAEQGGMDTETGEPDADVELEEKIAAMVTRRFVDRYTEKTGRLPF